MSHPLAPAAATLLAPHHRATQFQLTSTQVIILSAAAAFDGLTYTKAAEVTPLGIDVLRSNDGPIKKLISEGLLTAERGFNATTKRANKIIQLTITGDHVLSIILTGTPPE